MPRVKFASAASTPVRLVPAHAVRIKKAASTSAVREIGLTALIGRSPPVSESDQLLGQPYTAPVADSTGQLAAGRRDVVTPWAADRRDEAGRAQSLPETIDGFRFRALEPGVREGIERDQIDLRRTMTQEPDELSCLGRPVV